MHKQEQSTTVKPSIDHSTESMRGLRKTSRGWSNSNANTGTTTGPAGGAVAVAATSAGRILINIYLIKFPRRRHCTSATGVVIYATQCAGDLLIETTRNSSSS